MQKYSKLIRQVFFFGLVGVGSLLLDLCVTTFLFNYAHFPAGVAGVIGFCSAFFFNFPLNRKHVFNHTKHDKLSLKMQISLYVTLSIFNLGVTAILMQAIVYGLNIQVSIAKLGVTAVIAIWNFLLFKFYIFAKRPNFTEVESLVIQ